MTPKTVSVDDLLESVRLASVDSIASHIPTFSEQEIREAIAVVSAMKPGAIMMAVGATARMSEGKGACTCGRCHLLSMTDAIGFFSAGYESMSKVYAKETDEKVS